MMSLVVVLVGSKAAQHRVHPTGGSRRVFRQVAWLETGSGKVAFPRPPPAGNANR